MFSLPPLVPNFSKSVESRKWEFKERNGISYWTRGNDGDFSLFNTKLSRPVATADGDWSLEETDYLLDLVLEYDARWSIIHDRFEFSGSNRSLTDLKDRYCQIQRKRILESHSSSDPIVKESLQKYHYDKFKENERRRNLEILYSRSESVLKEEEILFKEIKRRQYYQEIWEKEHDEIVTHLKDHKVDPPSVPPSTLTSLLDKKKRKSSVKDDYEIKRKRPSIEGSRESLDEILTRVKVSNISLRSTKMIPVKSGLQTKVNVLLEEAGVPIKPKMATSAILAKYDDLREKAKDILEMKKQLEKLEHDLKVVKIKKGEISDDHFIGDESVGSVGKKGLVAVI